MRCTSLWLLAIFVLVALAPCLARAASELPKSPLVERYLIEGKLTEGEEALLAELTKDPENDEARFSLGAIQFLRGVEHLMQAMHRYGLRGENPWWLPFLGLPGFELPIPSDPKPDTFSYADARQILQDFIDQLQTTEATLAEVKDPDVKLPLRFGLITLDLNRDGIAPEHESLWRIFARLAPRTRVDAEAARKFVISFDRGDVHWLRGYCHLLSAFCEVALAHNWEDLFQRTAHLVFLKPETPYEFLAKEQLAKQDRFSRNNILDLIAFVHLINFELSEPNRMLRALEHLEATFAQSRESWDHILAEKDDDHEWIPNPNQTGVIPNLRVTKQVVNGWMSFLDEAEAIFAGKKLIPFWRGDDKRGVNFRRVFTEPRRFDLVLWVQGTDAVPYLEEGPRTQPTFWWRLWQLFQGRFLTFAVWFN